MAAREHEDSPWQVRVCTDEGTTVGAGVLLGDRRGLTCAHGVRGGGGAGGGVGGGGGARAGERVLRGDRRVLTCAHVVRGAGVSAGGPAARLRIDSVVCHP